MDPPKPDGQPRRSLDTSRLKRSSALQPRPNFQTVSNNHRIFYRVIAFIRRQIMKKALITGITGPGRLLPDRVVVIQGYEVYGVIRAAPQALIRAGSTISTRIRTSMARA